MTRAHHSSRTLPEDAMRLLLRYALLAVGLAVWGCRSDTTSVLSTLAAPQNLAYQLDPRGHPNRPAGIFLVLGHVQSSALGAYRVYSLSSTGGAFGLQGLTRSNTSHSNGAP